MPFRRLITWYERYERPISSLSLVGGFIFDSLTLRRIDLVAENVWMLFNLLLASVGVVLINSYENRKEGMTELARARWHFWLLIAIQFAFGGLMSTILVFYVRSSTFAASWPFLLLLAAVFIGNEIFKKHYIRLAYQVAVWFIAVYSFSIFVVPVLLGRMGPEIFILSGAVSVALLILYIACLRYIARERFRKSWKMIAGAVIGITALINTFYFANIIPPIPLALKDAGVYHTLKRRPDGDYDAAGQQRSWRSFFRPQIIQRTEKQPLYVYTAVFSPTKFDTTITHVWQFYDENGQEWVTMSEIPLRVVGGRGGGFRTYSMKQALFPGEWRVDAKTSRGQIIGRTRFDIENVEVLPILTQSVLY